MQLNWTRYLRLTVVFLVACSMLGLAFGHALWGLATGLFCCLGWTLLQTHKLSQWLGNPSASSEPPASMGFWGEVFDALHRLQKGHLLNRDRLQAQINRVQESTNAMRDGVIMTDTNGGLVWWNDSAEYLLGLRRGSDRGQLIYNLIRKPAFKVYFDARDYREPLDLNSPAKPHLRLQIQISLFGDNERLIVAKDVTRLFQLEQMRRDFVGNVSHEMRTPLTVISGYLETMVDNADQLPPKWRRAITTMARQSSRMEALITDLILLSRLETGEQMLDDAVTDIRALVTQICHDAQALSGDQNHQFTLTIGDSCYLRGDRSQLRSAFSNLIFNAVKYTPAGGHIVIRWSTDKQGAHLSVQDTGPGIDAVHIPRLTERFYRADPSRHQETGGTGLGLAIVKHVLLNHDGRLEIRSVVGS